MKAMEIGEQYLIRCLSHCYHNYAWGLKSKGISTKLSWCLENQGYWTQKIKS